jgi:uncharacterized protein (DUF4415 family)
MKRGIKTAKGRRNAAQKAAQGTARKQHNLLGEVGRLYKPIKRPITLRMDADVLAWFKRRGRGYQTRINRALRRVMMGSK